MTKSPALPMFQRKSLDQITEIPDQIISVYVVENHIWSDGGSEKARAERGAQPRTVDEFLIGPVRPFLNDIFRQMAAPYSPERKDAPIGQGYWIQAEFGAGKSHLLSFIGSLALGGEAEWALVRDKERKEGLGRRESLYNFYETGIAKKTTESKGIFVAVKTLVGQGGGAIGVSDTGRTFTEYVLDAVAEQFYQETGRSLPLYPTEILAQRFLHQGDLERYQRDLAKFLKDPTFFDDEEQEELGDFLNDLQTNLAPGVQRDCGQRLWDFYISYLKIQPMIPMETEDILEHMVRRLLDEGYAGLLLILDEVSLFMQGRSGGQRVEDEKALVVLSNRLAKVKNLPVWTVCAAQQAIESKMAGVKNILARERLDLVSLLNQKRAYYDIALSRVREVTDAAAVDQYYEDYKRSFSWPQSVGKDEFARFFPFYPPSMDVVREVSLNLTTVRSALYFMLQTLKTQRKRESRELITLWSLFDDVVEYEEDPSGTTKGIASIKTKWPDDWHAYQTGKRQLDTEVKGPLKVYRGRCEKIIKTLFLYHVAHMAPNGLSHEDLMNSVMEWKDHGKGQEADLQDNLDHYEILADRVAHDLAQVVKVGQNYRFNPTGGGTDPRELFRKARADAEQSEVLQRQAWEALLALDGWEVTTRLMTMDLAFGTKSIFRETAPSSQKDITLKWHNREITGRVYMRDLLDIAKRSAPLPSINSSETGLDYAAFISSTPATDQLDQLVKDKDDARALFWSPDALTSSERSLLIDLAAYRTLVTDYSGRDTQEAKDVLDWVQGRLRDHMGPIYRIVPASYGRGRIAAQDHSEMPFAAQGELAAILTPLVAQVLDATYVCSEMEFDAPAPFNDTNAVNAINGVVKVGEIPHGARPNREISAAQNYGFALQIMRRPNNRKLDLAECRYTREMSNWISEKLGDAGAIMPVVTVYKNFMGIGGPNGQNFGLSRRMVQLYLLCLVREGRIRLTLSGRGTPVEAIDYTNIAGLDFKTATLESFHQVQRLRPPEGWEVLAPFAAALLDDEGLRIALKDSEIQAGVQRLLSFKQEQQENFPTLYTGLADLFEEIGRETSIQEQLAAWVDFLKSPIKPNEPIPFLRHALQTAFGYPIYPEDTVRQADVDDLAMRRQEVHQATTFFAYRERVRAAARYARFEVPDQPQLAGVRETLQLANQLLEDLDGLIASEARLLSRLLEPVEEAIDTYSVRYLQVFDQVTAHAEQARMDIEAIPEQSAYRALGRLARVKALGADSRPLVDHARRQILATAASAGSAQAPTLFPTALTRAEVERRLRSWPQPPGCNLTLENADEWIQRADEALRKCRNALDGALLKRATLLHSEALRERLVQGNHEPFIEGLLRAKSAEEVAEYLAPALGSEDVGEPDPVELLIRYLKKLNVRKLRLSDFEPGKRTIEVGDVDQIVADFRTFITAGLEGGHDELQVVELE